MNNRELLSHLPISARFRALRHAIQIRRAPEMQELLEHLLIIEEECSVTATMRREIANLLQENNQLKLGKAL